MKLDPVWLLPLTYLIHLVEEYYVAGGFAEWLARETGIPLSTAAFVGWNAFGLTAMVAGAALVERYRSLRWMETSMWVAVAGNSVAHLIASAATMSYSPGLITGLVLWLPLAVARVPAVHRELSARARRAGIGVGVVVFLLTFAALAIGLVA